MHFSSQVIWWLIRNDQKHSSHLTGERVKTKKCSAVERDFPSRKMTLFFIICLCKKWWKPFFFCLVYFEEQKPRWTQQQSAWRHIMFDAQWHVKAANPPVVFYFVHGRSTKKTNSTNMVAIYGYRNTIDQVRIWYRRCFAFWLVHPRLKCAKPSTCSFVESLPSLHHDSLFWDVAR